MSGSRSAQTGRIPATRPSTRDSTLTHRSRQILPRQLSPLSRLRPPLPLPVALIAEPGCHPPPPLPLAVRLVSPVVPSDPVGLDIDCSYSALMRHISGGVRRQALRLLGLGLRGRAHHRLHPSGRPGGHGVRLPRLERQPAARTAAGRQRQPRMRVRIVGKLQGGCHGLLVNPCVLRGSYRHTGSESRAPGSANRMHRMGSMPSTPSIGGRPPYLPIPSVRLILSILSILLYVFLWRHLAGASPQHSLTPWVAASPRTRALSWHVPRARPPSPLRHPDRSSL